MPYEAGGQSTLPPEKCNNPVGMHRVGYLLNRIYNHKYKQRRTFGMGIMSLSDSRRLCAYKIFIVKK